MPLLKTINNFVYNIRDFISSFLLTSDRSKKTCSLFIFLFDLPDDTLLFFIIHHTKFFYQVSKNRIHRTEGFRFDIVGHICTSGY